MTEATLPTRDQHHAYLLLRLLTGFDFFGHGFARIFTGTHLSGFAQGMVKSMATSPLPPSLTLVSGYAIPVVELLIGVLLLLGFFTRAALTLAFLLMMVLMFGVTMKQDWTAAGQQMVYGLILATLFFARQPYDISWPRLFRLGL
jgi:thiosulfate dehydrogenase (quinone) large subunit